jgi:predicted methyltransferase
MKAYNGLVRKGLLKGLSLNQNVIDMTKISPYFPGLKAWELEILLCDLGKSIRRVEKGIITDNPLYKPLDIIVSTVF